jgi:predicted DCC family thiol-disulfide oxidoreductase YuxK
LSSEHDGKAEGLQIVYDGECPFCSQFVTLYKAKSVVGKVDLIDAREDHPAVRLVKSKGLDLDEGMAVLWDGQIYHGADAVHFMAMVGSESGVFNRLNKLIFRSKPLARTLYPWMVAGRNLTLRLLGRRALAKADKNVAPNEG